MSVAGINRTVIATFNGDANDSDGDALTNYQEIVVFGSDPNDVNSDDDNFTDFQEFQYGLDPNVANENLLTYISTVESNATADGNSSGKAWVQANPSSYNLYTEAEKNSSDSANYANGIAWVQSNLSSYNLYTESEKNASMESAKTSGMAEANATIQADLATKGLSLITYSNQVDFSKPYTSSWFYQPGMGWLWTDESIFPFIYRVKVGETNGSWLYFGQLSGQASASFYDYTLQTWITPTGSN